MHEIPGPTRMGSGSRPSERLLAFICDVTTALVYLRILNSETARSKSDGQAVFDVRVGCLGSIRLLMSLIMVSEVRSWRFRR